MAKLPGLGKAAKMPTIVIPVKVAAAKSLGAPKGAMKADKKPSKPKGGGEISHPATHAAFEALGRD
jgi:hypothetical protein